MSPGSRPSPDLAIHGHKRPIAAMASPMTISARDMVVFYGVSGATVEVLAIVAKSEALSWLAEFGNPE